ncbi:efflux RND transporter periplasmic adaptor subunit [Cellulomonas sp. KRMCY2]|uniref:efflux RND transporter periplasmic adaptor subunit n=1 Tax=Cellulomonas sp. KRMCY2 TaxID=1304865 RepID=UPI001E2D43BE|nr:hypothetical protein [Cellulomonas sp. KRMCY2]
MTGSTRTIWIMAITAVVSLGAGLGLSRLIISPADAAANAAPPEAGQITVPVERRLLANDVVLRGDAIYEDPVNVTLETGDLGGAAIVTGQVPEVGATLDAGAVMLEVTGRPVILLAGELPVYRTLRVGVSGPDVLQLKAALGALGIDAGDPESDDYDAATAAAVVELYNRVGYAPPTAGADADDALDAARDMVRSAEEQVTTARQEVDHPQGGTLQSQRLAARQDADLAYIAYHELLDSCAAPVPEGTDPPNCSDSAVRSLEFAMNVAIAARDEANAAPDTSAAQAALTSAQRALTDAREDLAKAQQDVITPLPSSEVVYLSATPRRVDSVNVKRGATVAGTAVMSVSGATLQIAGNVSQTDADLIAEGSPVTITLPGGEDVTGTVLTVGVPAAGDTASEDSDRKRVVVVPDALTEEQRAELQGANVRMTIPVSSTEGEVLAVPTAALTAGPGGEARVEVLGDDDASTLVTVEPGLAAGGFVEVTAVDGELAEGDRVVIGITGGGAADEQGTDETDADTEEPTDDATTEPTTDESGDA